MPKPEHISLIPSKRNLPKLAPPANTELEEHLLPSQSVKEDAKKDVEQDVKQHSNTPDISHLKPKRGAPSRPVNFRLPEHIYEILVQKAQHNGIAQTTIVVEALRVYLEQLPGPPSV